MDMAIASLSAAGNLATGITAKAVGGCSAQVVAGVQCLSVVMNATIERLGTPKMLEIARALIQTNVLKRKTRAAAAVAAATASPTSASPVDSEITVVGR